MHTHAYTDTYLENLAQGAGEMAQQLRALASLAEDPDSVPSTHVRFITII